MSINNLNRIPDAPTSSSDEQSSPDQPFTPFPWHDNRFQEALQSLHDVEPAAQQVLVETMAEIRRSNLFWKLMTSYSDAMKEAKGNSRDELHVELAMFARMYLAGTQRGGDPLEGLGGAVGGD